MAGTALAFVLLLMLTACDSAAPAGSVPVVEGESEKGKPKVPQVQAQDTIH